MQAEITEPACATYQPRRMEFVHQPRPTDGWLVQYPCCKPRRVGGTQSVPQQPTCQARQAWQRVRVVFPEVKSIVSI